MLNILRTLINREREKEREDREKEIQATAAPLSIKLFQVHSKKNKEAKKREIIKKGKKDENQLIGKKETNYEYVMKIEKA